jgi:hypothetical protein
MITGLAALREDIYHQPFLLPPTRTRRQRNGLDNILRGRIRGIQKPPFTPKNDQPDPIIRPAAIRGAQLQDLPFQIFRGKSKRRLKVQETHAGKKTFKMILPQPYSTPSYQHCFEETIAVAETPVVGCQYTLT